MIRIKFTNEETLHTVSFTRVNEHVVTLHGNTNVLNNVNTSGFCTYKANDDMLLGDLSDYITVYRVTPEYIQYSNDGSVWEEPAEPTRDVPLTIQWDDADNAEGIRPEHVAIVINDNTEIMLTALNDWRDAVYNVPESEKITITSAEEIEGYTSILCGRVVVYHHEYIDPHPSLEDRVTDVEDAVIELYDLMLASAEEEE